MATNYTVYNTSSTSTDPIETQQVSLASSSVLHKSNTSEFLLGYCTSILGQTSVYQSTAQVACQYYENVNISNAFCDTLPYTNDTNTCSSYWSRKLQTLNSENENNTSTSTSRQMHWLNGGYFYGMKEYRKYIYNEMGTIHFSTAVKFDIKSNDTDTNIDYIKQFYVPNNEFRLVTPYLLSSSPQIYYNSPSMFFINEAYRSIERNYLLPQITAKSLTPSIKYDSTIGKYKTIFKENDLFINNCGSYACPSSILQTNTVDLTSSTDGIAVMLSNGNVTYFPLINENINSSFTHRKSFVISDIHSSSCSTSNEKIYYDFITKTKNVFDFADVLVGTVENSTLNSYLINNSFKNPYTFITSSNTLENNDSIVYNNYKFICSVKNIDGNYLLVVPEDTLKTVINTFNEYEDITSSSPSSERGHSVLFNILDRMTRIYGYPLIVTLFEYSSAGSNTIKLNKTIDVLIPGTFIVDYYYSTGLGLVISLNNNEQLAINQNKKYALMLKASTSLINYTSNTKTPTSSLVLENKNYYTLDEISMLDLKAVLFDSSSPKLSTPDYTSLMIRDDLNNIKEVPLRGTEYSLSEKDNYPIIRYVRKANGRFYIQILAGAFPYYHAIPHYPVVKQLTESGSDLIKDSLNKICTKHKSWYNHVSTTKWMCYIKHTELGSDPTDYIATENSKGAPAIKPSKYIGKTPSAYGGSTASGSGSVIANVSANRLGTGIINPITVTPTNEAL
jgi:hypothetical protein